MKAMLKMELHLSQRVLLIWLGAVWLIGLFAYFEYLALQDNLDDLAALVNGFPNIVRIMFGIKYDLNTALGWFCCLYFWLTLLTNGYAVYLGVSCVAKEQEQKTAEYLFTRPLSRGQIVVAKALASVCNLFILAAGCGLCGYFLGGLRQVEAALHSTIGLFMTEVLLFALALLAAVGVKAYKWTVRLGAAMLIGCYALHFAAQYLNCLPLVYLTPLGYFDVYYVTQAGLNPAFILFSLDILLISITLSGQLWRRREI